MDVGIIVWCSVRQRVQKETSTRCCCDLRRVFLCSLMLSTNIEKTQPVPCFLPDLHRAKKKHLKVQTPTYQNTIQRCITLHPPGRWAYLRLACEKKNCALLGRMRSEIIPFIHANLSLTKTPTVLIDIFPTQICDARVAFLPL